MTPGGTLLLLAAAAVALALGPGCQGSFDPPLLDNPRDPQNGQLPPTPANVSASPLLCLQPPPHVEVTWSTPAAPGISGFQIYRAASPAEDPGLLIASVPGSQRRYEDGEARGEVPALAETTRYWYRVRALGQGGVPGLRSNSVSARTAGCP